MTKANQFRDDEITTIKRWDKTEKKWVKTSYPKIAGRLRLAHEVNETLSITSQIVNYNEDLAVVKVVAETPKGQFHGLGMASTDRDQNIAPAILELAETRAIARALRFAGYGVEYCSAEEVSHLDHGHRDQSDQEDEKAQPPPAQKPNTRNDQPPEKDNGSGRITNKQLNFIVNLGKSLGLSSKDLDAETLESFGVKLAYLTIKDASDFIEQLKSRPS